MSNLSPLHSFASRRWLTASVVAALGLFASCSQPSALSDDAATLDLATLSAGVYRAYPEPVNAVLTAAPEGYEPFYLSTYNRHGSRYQPNDKRYAQTLQRLTEAHNRDGLTPYGESLLPQIQVLCDSCLGHGGLLTSVGARQLQAIGQRTRQRFPEIFSARQGDGRLRFISARASVVRRCGQSMEAFLGGLGDSLNVLAESDSAFMAYLVHDTPAMRQLSSSEASWQQAFRTYYQQHGRVTTVLNRIMTQADGIDTLQFIDDLYWLTIGMQNVEVPGCDLSEAFTPDELFECYRSVNYRMYVCNGNAPLNRHVPAESASTLLLNLVESADQAIASDTVAATLRFGHDTNLLRLLALMRIQGTTAEVSDPAEAWRCWQEASLCPMAGNLQLVFYRNAEGDVLVKFLHNEYETQLDTDEILPVCAPYYSWRELREFFLHQIRTDNETTDFIEPVL